ncbi:hypothetical protein [Microbulbifer sp. GL-2]|nr:hypothetical protein [Microbulbifer sp. GL-2]
MIHTNDRIIKYKTGLLNLAEELCVDIFFTWLPFTSNTVTE